MIFWLRKENVDIYDAKYSDLLQIVLYPNLEGANLLIL